MVGSAVVLGDEGEVRRLRPRATALEEPVRVVLVGQTRLDSEGLSSLLDRHGMDIVDQVDDLDRVVELWRATHPHVVIIDQRSSDAGGRRFDLGWLRDRVPDLGVVLLTDDVDLAEVRGLLASTAGVAYLLKDRLPGVAELLDAVQRVIAGDAVLEPEVVRQLAGARGRPDPLSMLTSRQIEILALMAEGLSNLGIARRLFIAEGTVEKHVRSILSKLMLPEAPEDHRRVLAVIAYIESR